MHRGSTPTLIIECDRDISDITALRIAFSQKNKVILEKTEDVCSIKGNTIEVYLSEEETLLFETDNHQNAFVQIQVKFAYGNKRLISDIVQAIIKPILKDGKMFDEPTEPPIVLRAEGENIIASLNPGCYSTASTVEVNAKDLDENLKPENISRGSVIFGVKGSAEGGKDRFDDVIEGIPVEFIERQYRGAETALMGIAFSKFSLLETGDTPNLSYCRADSVNMEKVERILGRNFQHCELGDVSMKLCTNSEATGFFGRDVQGLMYGAVYADDYANTYCTNYTVDLNSAGEEFDLLCYDSEETRTYRGMFRNVGIQHAIIKGAKSIKVSYFGSNINIGRLDVQPQVVYSEFETTGDQIVEGFGNINELVFRSPMKTELLKPLDEKDANAIGALYVKDELVQAYKEDPNWKPIETKIHGISELPAIS